MKTQLNNKQVKLAQSWLPSGSWPYAYDNKGTIWYWKLHYSGVPIKSSTKLSKDQLAQLDQLAS